MRTSTEYPIQIDEPRYKDTDMIDSGHGYKLAYYQQISVRYKCDIKLIDNLLDSNLVIICKQMPSIVFLIALLVHMPFYCIALHLMFAEEILVIMV